MAKNLNDFINSFKEESDIEIKPDNCKINNVIENNYQNDNEVEANVSGKCENVIHRAKRISYIKDIEQQEVKQPTDETISKPKTLKLNLKPKQVAKETIESANTTNKHLAISQEDLENFKSIYDNQVEVAYIPKEIKQKSENIDTRTKTIVPEEVSVEDPEFLFKKTGTSLQFKEKWMLVFEKARNANVNTMFNKKVANGRFRFAENGELEILPDLETYGKSSKDLLSMRWDEQNK